jgi:hypothetical protein
MPLRERIFELKVDGSKNNKPSGFRVISEVMPVPLDLYMKYYLLNFFKVFLYTFLLGVWSHFFWFVFNAKYGINSNNFAKSHVRPNPIELKKDSEIPGCQLLDNTTTESLRLSARFRKTTTFY